MFTHRADETKPSQTNSCKGWYHNHHRLNDPIKLQQFTLLAGSHGCNLYTPVDVNGSSFINFVVLFAHYFATMFTCEWHMRISNIYIYIYVNRSGIDLIILLFKQPSRTQLLHQPLHIYKIYTLKMLRHVSVLRPSSGSYIYLAKVTLEIVTD